MAPTVRRETPMRRDAGVSEMPEPGRGSACRRFGPLGCQQIERGTSPLAADQAERCDVDPPAEYNARVLFSRRHLVACAAGLCATRALPSGAVRLIVPYPAGGATDQVARLVARTLSRIRSTPIYVDNRPGASGTLGMSELARARADGSTIGLGTISTLVLVPRARAVDYDPLRSFELIGPVGSAPFLVVVTPGLPVTTLDELVALLRREPDRYNYASVGDGSLPHRAGREFQAATGTEIVHVPYPGAPQARIDLIAGRVHLMFDQVATFSPATLTSGALRPLAVMGPRRAAQLPHLPTAAEAGWPQLEATMWIGMLAPAGLPEPMVQSLSDDLAVALRDHATRAAIQAIGFDAEPGSRAAFRRFVQAQLER